jgi:hypothetical protein
MCAVNSSGSGQSPIRYQLFKETSVPSNSRGNALVTGISFIHITICICNICIQPSVNNLTSQPHLQPAA